MPSADIVCNKAFLGMNIALTGVPLFLFILFTLVVAIFALLVGLILGLLGAVFFILFAVGTALLFVLPTIFFTTFAACFLFLWGLGGYYILKWANGGDGEGKEGEGGKAIGDRLNELSGGRLTGFMDAAKKEQSKSDIKGFNDENTKPEHKKEGEGHQQPNGSAEKDSGKASGVEEKVDGVTKTAKGGLSSVTG